MPSTVFTVRKLFKKREHFYHTAGIAIAVAVARNDVRRLATIIHCVATSRYRSQRSSSLTLRTVTSTDMRCWDDARGLAS